MTAPLWQQTVDLGLGHSAILEIDEVEREPPPTRGCEWPDEIDWPRARLTIFLPGPSDGYAYVTRIHPEIETGDFSSGWGSTVVDARRATHRERKYYYSAERLHEAVVHLQRLATTELAPLIAHCRARADRLARREATLARGHAPKDQGSIEIDAAPRAAYMVPEHDDSSERFALLELDTKTEQQPTTKPARRRRAA